MTHLKLRHPGSTGLGKWVWDASRVDENLPANYHTTRRDGRDAAGKKAPAGIYFCHMCAGDFAKTQKMTLLL